MTLVPLDNRYPGESAQPVGMPNLNGMRQEEPLSSVGLDIPGALFRRKFVVILLAILGAGMGYLSYARQPEVYSSSLRLMIWSQAPPKMVQGESILRQNSIPKHQNLLLSEVVLRDAVENPDAGLSKLSSLSNSPSSVGTLKQMLSARTVSNNDDTLIVTAVGENPDDLPRILNQVVDSYQEILEKDSQAVGKEMVELIKKFQHKTDTELSTAERRYLELVKELGMTARMDNEKVGFVNPHTQRYNELVAELEKNSNRLVDINQRLKMLRAAAGSGDENQMSVVAIEGRQHLGLHHPNHNNPDGAGNTHERAATLQPLNTRISELEDRIMSLQFEYRRLGRSFGTGSPDMLALEQDIELWKEELVRMEREKAMTLGQEVADEPADPEQLRRNRERQWTVLYFVSLQRDRERSIHAREVLERQIGETTQKATRIAGNVAELNVLRTQIVEKRIAARVILDRISEINVLSNDYNMFKVRVIDSPRNGYKTAPVLTKSLGYGTFLGSLLGIGLALLIDRFDMSFRTPSEIFGKLGAPVIGRIPRIKAEKGPVDVKGSTSLVTVHRAGSGAAEAFRAARTCIFFAMSTHGYRSFLVTSPSPGDGKSTFACNIAISIAQAGKRTLLVDADFRRPRIHRYMGEALEPGITEVLNGEVPLSKSVQRSFQENLYLLTTGGRPKNPGELVTSSEFKELLHKVTAEFDVIIIDSSPLLPVADATVISSYIDGVYMVMRIRKGIKISAQRARDNLDSVDANLLGVVVNGMDENPHYNEYGYYYNTHYRDYGRYYENGTTDKGSGKSRKRIRSNT